MERIMFNLWKLDWEEFRSAAFVHCLWGKDAPRLLSGWLFQCGGRMSARVIFFKSVSLDASQQQGVMILLRMCLCSLDYNSQILIPAPSNPHTIFTYFPTQPNLIYSCGFCNFICPVLCSVCQFFRKILLFFNQKRENHFVLFDQKIFILSLLVRNCLMRIVLWNTILSKFRCSLISETNKTDGPNKSQFIKSCLNNRDLRVSQIAQTVWNSRMMCVLQSAN